MRPCGKLFTEFNECRKRINILSKSVNPGKHTDVPNVNYHSWDVCLHCGDFARLLSERSQTSSYADNEGVEPDSGQSDLCVRGLAEAPDGASVPRHTWQAATSTGTDSSLQQSTHLNECLQEAVTTDVAMHSGDMSTMNWKKSSEHPVKYLHFSFLLESLCFECESMWRWVDKPLVQVM